MAASIHIPWICPQSINGRARSHKSDLTRQISLHPLKLTIYGSLEFRKIATRLSLKGESNVNFQISYQSRCGHNHLNEEIKGAKYACTKIILRSAHTLALATGSVAWYAHFSV